MSNKRFFSQTTLSLVPFFLLRDNFSGRFFLGVCIRCTSRHRPRGIQVGTLKLGVPFKLSIISTLVQIVLIFR
jgi:hypothetical protein